MTTPLKLLNTWLAEEKTAGAPNPCQAILSTVAQNAIPHARVIAIREINENSLIFFTQSGTRKVKELTDNPHASLTFWLELKQREVIIEGIAERLADEENANYWESYPREAQLRFYSYAPTSSQPITSKDILESRKIQLEDEYQDKILPLSPYYCGFRVIPKRMVFYAYRTDELSDVFEFHLQDGTWAKQWLSP